MRVVSDFQNWYHIYVIFHKHTHEPINFKFNMDKQT